LILASKVKSDIIMPRIVWENNQLQIQYYSADDLIKFVETAIVGPARQLGLSVEVRKENSDQDATKKTRIQTVRM
jgi:hypothetical protein